MPEAAGAYDGVAVATADPLLDDVPRLLELPDDLLDGALGYADPLGDVPEPGVGGRGEADEDVSVVGQEGPAVRSGHGHTVGQPPTAVPLSGGERASEDLPGQRRLRRQAQHDVRPLAVQVVGPSAAAAILQPLVQREDVEEDEQRHEDPVDEPGWLCR